MILQAWRVKENYSFSATVPALVAGSTVHTAPGIWKAERATALAMGQPFSLVTLRQGGNIADAFIVPSRLLEPVVKVDATLNQEWRNAHGQTFFLGTQFQIIEMHWSQQTLDANASDPVSRVMTVDCEKHVIPTRLIDKLPAARLPAFNPVERISQDVFGERGNCFSACLAMVLNVPLWEVPNFNDRAGHSPELWCDLVNAWLEPLGWRRVTVQPSDGDLSWIRGICIVSGVSRPGVWHATVWRDGRLLHDPSPEPIAITDIQADFLVPIDPAAFSLTGRPRYD